MSLFNQKYIAGIFIGVMILIALGVMFAWSLAPMNGAGASGPAAVFQISQGEGFRGIAGELSDEHLIRSKISFEILAVLEGRARALLPGLYHLNAGMSAWTILSVLSDPSNRAITVTIPEGSNIYEIDAILANALVIHRGDLIHFQAEGSLEGKLFPDTYQFFPDSKIQEVVQKMLDAFNAKAAPVLAAQKNNVEQSLIIASLLEKEVPDQADQKIVTGIIEKRIAHNMPLDIDATICYLKIMSHPTSSAGCYPITSLDKKIDSPYNTYLYKGLPPGPIGNPGISAITAAMDPQTSPYYYYLSDPKTGKTVYAIGLDEQLQNEVKYLGI